MIASAGKVPGCDHKSIDTHLTVVHGPGDCSEIAKGDPDRRVRPKLGPVERGAGALLQQAGAHRPGWLGPWQKQQEQQDGGQVGGHRGQPMGAADGQPDNTPA